MNTQHFPKLFPITIRLDEDGIDWVHFVGGIGHVLTLRELPEPFQPPVIELIDFLQRQGVKTLKILPSSLICQINGVHRNLLQDTPNIQETLCLLAWWLEWSNRRVVSHGWWQCPECADHVTARRGHCKNPECPSWNILFQITGESILELVPKTGTNAS